jgi:hypothetical protein
VGGLRGRGRTADEEDQGRRRCGRAEGCEGGMTAEMDSSSASAKTDGRSAEGISPGRRGTSPAARTSRPRWCCLASPWVVEVVDDLPLVCPSSFKHRVFTVLNLQKNLAEAPVTSGAALRRSKDSESRAAASEGRPLHGGARERGPLRGVHRVWPAARGAPFTGGEARRRRTSRRFKGAPREGFSLHSLWEG